MGDKEEGKGQELLSFLGILILLVLNSINVSLWM